jgi:hypothetical protein
VCLAGLTLAAAWVCITAGRVDPTQPDLWSDWAHLGRRDLPSSSGFLLPSHVKARRPVRPYRHPRWVTLMTTVEYRPRSLATHCVGD